MNWVEIITLRSPGNIDRGLVGELMKSLSEFDAAADTSARLIEIKMYLHSVVESDLSIHIYWKSEQQASQQKSPIGFRVASMLKPLGLLNHSVWVEATARKIERRAERNPVLK